MAEKKAFLANPKHQNRVPNMKNRIAVPIMKRIEIIIVIYVCLISWMNVNDKENGGR